MHVTTSVGDDHRPDVHAPREGLVGKGQVGQRFVDGDVHRDVGAATAVVGKNGVGGCRLIGCRAARDGPVGEHQVVGQRRVDGPCQNVATGVGDDHRAHVLIPSVRLIGKCQVCQRLVDGDVDGDVGAATAVVGKDGVSGGCLVGCWATGDGPVGENQVSGQRRVNAPCRHETASISHHHRAHVHVPRVRLVGQRQFCQWLIDGDVHRDVGRPARVVGENGVRHRRLVGGWTAGDGAVGKHKVVRQGRMDAPCLNETTVVGDNDGSDINVTRVALVGEGQVGQRFVHRDVNRDVRRTAAVVGKNRVGHGRLVGGRAAGDGAVIKHEVVWKSRVDAPRRHVPSCIGHRNGPDILASREDLIGEGQVCQRFVDGDVHRDVD